MPAKEWMLGLPGHNEVVTLDDVLLLVKGGALRPTDLVKKLGEPWRAANEVPELAGHFAPAGGPPKRSSEPVRETARKTVVPPPRASARPSDSRPPAVEKPSDSKPPRHEDETDVIKKEPPPSDSRPATAPATPAPRKIELPKPPPRVKVPTLEPMVEKYFSPVDLLRCASYAFDPRKLLLALVLAAPLAVVGTLLYVSSGTRETALEKVAGLGALTVAVFGFAVLCVALAYVTRRQIESRDWSFGEVARWTLGKSSTAFVFPVVVLMPSLVSAGLLWVLGLLRNQSTGMASALRIVYVVPMLFALVAVLGGLAYQLACMFVPAAAAIEGLALVGSVSAAWSHVRRQWGRIVLHWLIVTVATGVIAWVCLNLAGWTLLLPELMFGVPDDPEIAEAWSARFVPIQRVYEGVACSLGMILPLSLFATLGTLSYCSLRVAVAQQISAPPEETRSGTRPGPDATTPAPTAADSKPL